MEAEQKVTWDCIWFGSYPQAEVVTKAMKKADAISGLNGYDSSANDRNIDYRNKNFLNSAFNVVERYAIQNTLIANDENLEYGTIGGEDTTDKLFFLSESEVYTDDAKSYGFVIDGSIWDEAGNAKSSTYAKAMGQVEYQVE